MNIFVSIEGNIHIQFLTACNYYVLTMCLALFKVLFLCYIIYFSSPIESIEFSLSSFYK